MDLTQFEGHTPGPWSAASWDADKPKPDDPAIMAGDEPVVSLMWYDGPVLAVSEPDARLIAAAPDLLALCREQAETIRAERARADQAAAELTEARRQLTTCTCGSGAHPRPCYVHPDAYARHIAEIEADNQRDWRVAHDAVVTELTEARAEIAALMGWPGGGLPGWELDAEVLRWERHSGNALLRVEMEPDEPKWEWAVIRDGVCGPWGTTDYLRDAMRAADAALAGASR